MSVRQFASRFGVGTFEGQSRDYERALHSVLSANTNKAVVDKWQENAVNSLTVTDTTQYMLYLFQDLDNGVSVNQANGDELTLRKIRLAFDIVMSPLVATGSVVSANNALVGVYIVQNTLLINFAGILQTPSDPRSPIAYQYRDTVKVLFYRRYLLNSHNILEFPVASTNSRDSYGAYDTINIYRNSLDTVKVGTTAKPNAVTEGLVHAFFVVRYGNISLNANFSCVFFDS